MASRTITRCLATVTLLSLMPLASAQEAKVRMVPPEGDGAKYWPRWRGPSGQGVVAEGSYPDKWSPTENVVWKVPVSGQGNSSPIIWRNQLFLTAAYEKGQRRSIVCFDRTDGKQLWETFAPQQSPERAQGKNGWASGTPTTDGERVYAYFGSGGLLCCDLEGKHVWHQPFPIMDALHGMACSPLLLKDKVIIFQEHKPAGFIAAYDKRTGNELWKTPRKETVSWGSPIAVTVEGKEQIIVSSSMRVYAYDPDTGKEIWTCAGNLFEVIPTPVVGHDMIFCCSGRAGPTLAINPVGAQGDVTKTHLVWKTVKGSPFVPSPLVYGDYLYMVNDIISLVTCFEARTGKILWQERCGQPAKEGFSASPIGVGGKVFFTNDDGETFVMENGPKFNLLHVNSLGEKTLASPALVEGRWYIRTQRHLWCIGNKAG
jgi:outer membrane protein assembly factor BamB